MNELSRFKPLDHLPLSPGVCFICKGGVGPFIDTSLTVDYEGAIYVCIGCIKEMHSQLGLNSVINEEEVSNRMTEAYLQGHEQGHADTMRNLSEFISNHPDRSSGPVADIPVEPNLNSVATPGGAAEDNGESRRGNVESDSPISFQESGIISGYTSDGKSLFDLD